MPCLCLFQNSRGSRKKLLKEWNSKSIRIHISYLKAYLESSSNMAGLRASTTVSVVGAQVLRIAMKLPNLDVCLLGYRLV